MVKCSDFYGINEVGPNKLKGGDLNSSPFFSSDRVSSQVAFGIEYPDKALPSVKRSGLARR